jgi:hypothetical protein
MNPDLFQIAPFSWWFGAYPTLMQFISMATYAFWWILAILVALFSIFIIFFLLWLMLKSNR